MCRQRPSPSLSEYVVTWLDSIRGLVRPRTYEGYAYRLERHVRPRFGQRRLNEIGVDYILALIGDLREGGYSGWSIRSILTPLSRPFSHAVGANVVFVSRQLGHGSSDITLRVYSHPFDRAEQAARTRNADRLRCSRRSSARAGMRTVPTWIPYRDHPECPDVSPSYTTI